MQLKWLKDFVALHDYGSFSKAAEARYVTQPAFSRRIRSLENWLGVPLIDRNRYPTAFTATGIEFVEDAKRMVHEVYRVRDQLQGQELRESLVFFAQHSPAVSFFPHWIKTLEPLLGDTLVKLKTGNLHDVMESFSAGMGDFLLRFSSEDTAAQLARTDTAAQLARTDTACIQVGTDSLVAVSAANAQGLPQHVIGTNVPFKLLAYPQDSYLGSLVFERCLTRLHPETRYTVVCENALAEGLKGMAIQGYGIAWLPVSLIHNELKSGQLVVADSSLGSIELKILLYRFRHTSKSEVDSFWKYLTELYDHDIVKR